MNVRIKKITKNYNKPEYKLKCIKRLFLFDEINQKEIMKKNIEILKSFDLEELILKICLNNTEYELYKDNKLIKIF